MMPDISIIIVSTNELPFLKNCLHSIMINKGNVTIEIFVINNASTDQTKKFLTNNHPFIHIITNKERMGFAKNNNYAIQKAKGKYVLLLNPDTELLPNALKTIILYMNKRKNVGICAPKLLNPDGSLQYSCRRFPTWKSFLVRRTSLRYIFRETKINHTHLMQENNHNKIQEVDWLLGGCLCIRKKMIDIIGLLDDVYYLYVDDIDYCLRAWHAGWKVCYVPTARVIHHHQARSDKKLFSLYSLHHAKSMLHFIFKHGLFFGR